MYKMVTSGGGTKELKRFVKVCSLLGTTRIYTVVMAMAFSGRNFIPCQNKPKSTSQAILSTLLLQNSVTYGTYTLVNDMT
jgi:hypothetical protein